MHSEGSFEGSDYPQKATVREARNSPGTPIFCPFGLVNHQLPRTPFTARNVELITRSAADSAIHGRIGRL